MVRFACSVVLVACFAGSAAADIPPPPPERGFKRVPYVQTLKVEAGLTGYKFFPFQRLGLGGKETVGDELKPGAETGVPVPTSSSPSVRTGMVAVPDKVMADLKTKEELAKLLSRDNKDKLPAGVVVYETYGTVRDLKEGDPRTQVENVITAARDDKAGVKFTAKETPAPAGKDGPPKLSARPPLGLPVAGIAAALALVTFGIWLVRRK